MKKYKEMIKSAIVAVMCVSMLVGCGKTETSIEESEASTAVEVNEEVQADEEAESGELTKLVMGTTAWPTSMFAYLASELGYFEENGVEVEVQMFGAFGDSVQAFVGGNLDLITSPSSDMVAPFSQGAEFDVIMLTDKSMGADGMVAQKGIEKIEDLKGKTVATELYSVDHMYLLQLLDKAGMSEADITLTNMSISDAGTAIIAGQVDAAVVWEPYLSRAIAEGDTNLLYTSADDPDLITDCIAASKDVVENKKEAVQGFVDGWYKAVAYWRENVEESEAIMAEKMEMTPEDFRAMMDTLHIANLADAKESLTGSGDTSFVAINTKIAEFLKELDVIKEVPDISELLNSEFIEASTE